MSHQSVAFVICALGIANAIGAAVIIRSGLHVGNQDASERGEQADAFGAHGQMQLANYEGDEGFNRADEKQHAAAQDAGDFRAEGHDLLKQRDEADYRDKAVKQADGASVVDAGSTKGHKKGHRKTGFHHTYHKDESGSNSSYFDEALDAGDHYNRNSNQDSFADNAQRNQHGYHVSGAENAHGNRRQGGYDNGGQHMRNQAAGGAYSRKQHSDSAKVLDNRAAGNVYNEGGRLMRDEIVQKTPYWHESYVPSPPTHYQYRHAPHDGRITIYEDPAYLRRSNYRDFDRPRYYDDRINDFDYYY